MKQLQVVPRVSIQGEAQPDRRRTVEWLRDLIAKAEERKARQGQEGKAA